MFAFLRALTGAIVAALSPRAGLVAENLALRQPLAVRRRAAPRPRFSPRRPRILGRPRARVVSVGGTRRSRRRRHEGRGGIGAEPARRAADCCDIRRDRWEGQLQRRLCRFFFERDIRAFGTKIGWSELDVRAEDGFSSLLIEAKKVVSEPSAATINKWLTQLGSYMDQEHRAARGALVLYNFTSVPIFAPKETLLYRYLVVVINLCTDSPSKRAACIELSEGDVENPLRVVRVGTASAKPRARKRAAKKNTKKTAKKTARR